EENQNEKYFLSYNSLELKTTGLVHLVFQAIRYRREEKEKRRREELEELQKSEDVENWRQLKKNKTST
ncbi:Hypothetical protein FKW44_011630, partial [Caligus rogercresseyi]